MSGWKLLLCTLLLALSTSIQAAPSEPEALRNAAQQLMQGATLLHNGQAAQAIPLLQQVAAAYEQQYNNPKVRYYSATSAPEKLAYLTEAARDSRNAEVTLPDWGYAYYLHGYALIELGRLDEAKPLLQRALTLSPHNAQFRAE